MKGVVRLAEVWAMLGLCAPGYRAHETDHHWRIEFNGHTYPALPKGKHGNRRNPEIQCHHVRKMARQLEIFECAKARLPQIDC